MGALGLVRIAKRGEVGTGVIGTGMLLGVAVLERRSQVTSTLWVVDDMCLRYDIVDRGPERLLISMSMPARPT